MFLREDFLSTEISVPMTKLKNAKVCAKSLAPQRFPYPYGTKGATHGTALFLIGPFLIIFAGPFRVDGCSKHFFPVEMGPGKGHSVF
jgi:hypothetical protein